MDWGVIVSVLSGIVGLIGASVAIANASNSARKSVVDRQSKILDDLDQAYQRQSQRLEDLARAYKRLDKENERLRRALEFLRTNYETLLDKHNVLESQYAQVRAWAVERGYKDPSDV